MLRHLLLHTHVNHAVTYREAEEVEYGHCAAFSKLGQHQIRFKRFSSSSETRF